MEMNDIWDVMQKLTDVSERELCLQHQGDD
jgi:hypothetical protein